MNTWAKYRNDFICICVAVMFAILIVFGVAAEDNDIGICTEPNAVNYPGVETMDALKEAGLNPVNDGSCYYLKCVDAGLTGGRTPAIWEPPTIRTMMIG